MRNVKIAIIAVLASALLLGACGRRGALQAPPNAEKEEKQDESFILDPLVIPKR